MRRPQLWAAAGTLFEQTTTADGDPTFTELTPTTSDQHQRLYGMRQDTESLNAQLERAFYGQRLPAWGVHNQTVIVLLAAQAETPGHDTSGTSRLNTNGKQKPPPAPRTKTSTNC